MRARRPASLVVLAAIGAAAYFLLAPRFPKDQSVNVVLGDGAREVTDVDLHYGSAKGDEVSRDVALHFDP